ncbi:MAG: FCD domain-containing protein [Octadecabacter sp.]|nr:FCD domain-containing protein [Octadecabacter sp.]
MTIQDDTPNDANGNRAADNVVRALSESIYSGELPVGAPIPSEREIVEKFQISRTVAREAVSILSSKGLIDARPRYRPVVRQPDLDAALGVMGGLVQHMLSRPGGVKQLFDTRIFVETGLVRAAATDATKDDISNLRAALEANGECLDDSNRFFETDVAFHGALYMIPGNPVFPAIHRSFSDWLGGQWGMMPRKPDRNRRNHDAHQAIFKAILSRDPDEAEAELVSHLQDAWAQVADTFDGV